MQIPSELRPFSEKTLIVVTDRMHARLFLAEGRMLEQVQEKESDDLPIEGQERVMTTDPATGMTHVASDEMLKERIKERFFADLADRLFAMHKQDAFTSLVLIVSSEDKNELLEALHADVRNNVVRVIGKNLTNAPPLEIVERAQELPKE